MMTLPLAIYTADHGLAWTYPKQEIGFAELDACRTALSPLPDFDMGEMGYEGVWVTAERVFVAVCQSAPKWDFRGRDATYLAVTWMTREEAKSVDFEALLSHPALCTLTKNPPPFIDIHQTPMGSRPIQGLPTALPDFQSVGALISALPMNQTAKIKRNLNASNVTCRYETIGGAVEPQRMRTTAFTLMDQQPAPRMPKGEPRPTVIVPSPATTSTPLIIVLILLVLSVILNLYLGWEWLNQRPELKKTLIEKIQPPQTNEAQTDDGTDVENSQKDVTKQQGKDKISDGELTKQPTEMSVISESTNVVESVSVEVTLESVSVTQETEIVQEMITVKSVTNEVIQIEDSSPKLKRFRPRQNDCFEYSNTSRRALQFSTTDETLPIERK